MTFDRFYRLLASCLEGACERGDTGCVVRAKRECEYAPDDIGKLRGDHPVAGPGKANASLRYDTYHRLVVGSPDEAVEHLTGHTRVWWLRLERMVERRLLEKRALELDEADKSAGWVAR